MAETKEKLGKSPCPLCGHSLWVRRNAQGTVTIACDDCDFHGFAKKGTEAARRLTPATAPAPAATAPAPAPKPASKPASKPATTAPAPAAAPRKASPFDALFGGGNAAT